MDKNELISTINRKKESDRFKNISLEQLETVKETKEEFASRSVSINNYHKDPSIINIYKNIINLSEDEYDLSYVIELEAIKEIENLIESGDLDIDATKLLGKCDNSIKILINSFISEISIGIIDDLKNKAKLDGISHVVNEPLENITQSIKNNNFALISRITYKDTVDLINPPYNVSFEDINLSIQKGMSDSISAVQSAYNTGAEANVIDGLVEKSFAFKRLEFLKGRTDLSEASAVPLLRPMLEKLRNEFDRDIKEICVNKVNVSKNKVKM